MGSNLCYAGEDRGSKSEENRKGGIGISSIYGNGK